MTHRAFGCSPGLCMVIPVVAIPVPEPLRLSGCLVIPVLVVIRRRARPGATRPGSNPPGVAEESTKRLEKAHCGPVSINAARMTPRVEKPS